eukprot:14798286-Alexandrium_andersonii.AAC.1
MAQFLDLLREEIVPRGWLPFRTEWSIYDRANMVAGQIDSVWIDPATKSFHMIDWKRCLGDLDPAEGERFSRFGAGPCQSLSDNKFNHYAVQQNLYAAILRDCYGIDLSSMWLAQIHPGRSGYCLRQVPFFVDTAATLLQESGVDRVGGGIDDSQDSRCFDAVSYTHLRAHETSAHL